MTPIVIVLAALAVISLGVIVFLRTAAFGKMSVGPALERVLVSPNYIEGKFQNQSFTPDLTEGVSYYAVIKEFLFGKNKRSKPAGIIPSAKTNLHTLNPADNVLVWFGHSSYFLQVDGKRILVDPVLGGAASPIASTTRSYKGSDVYGPEDIPQIDYLFISHDHWDHLDYGTLVKLRDKIGKVVCGLGVAAHLLRWGFSAGQIIEADWNEEVALEPGFVVHTVPARHFSGRGLKRNQSLWLSYALATPTMNLFLGGDSGYDNHFKEAGRMYGPFDLAILECGQYDKSWKYIHMMPEEAVQATIDLKAAKLLPVHWGKFSLGNHAWDDPIIRVVAAAEKENVPLVHPMIGETLPLRRERTFSKWWEQVQ